MSCTRRYKEGTSAGRTRPESFVALKRKDGTKDYGLQLSIRSEPGAEDRPDLMMYVIRDAANARARHFVPVSREAVLAIGQSVAASIRVRPMPDSN